MVYNKVRIKQEIYSMKFSESIRPISYFKAHASEVVRDVSDNNKTMIITQNGEAKVVLQDVRAYEELQESLALLKILASSSKSLKENKFKTAGHTFKDIRDQIESKRMA
jgi:prevent-host-death family protein